MFQIISYVIPLKGAIVEQHWKKMIKLFIKTNLKSAGEESILINFFQNGFFLLLVKYGFTRYFLSNFISKLQKDKHFSSRM